MDPKKLSAQELVQLCLDSQDEALWMEFVRRFQPLIAGVINKCVFRRIGANLTLVDDLAQDTFLKLCANNFKALRNFVFKHENGLFGFLKVIAEHVAEDHFRSTDNLKHGGGFEEVDIEDAVAVLPSHHRRPQSVERDILLGEIKDCLAKCATDPNFSRDYSIFWLYYRYGFTAKAISKMPSIGLNVKGVESALLRLTRYVRDKLGDSGP
jgi:RNA polymerase sigma-70 factor (ECF subfamily)